MTPNPPKDQLGVSMVVSGGAVSPENRSNEDAAQLIAAHDANPPQGPWDECDGCHVEYVRSLLARIAAVEAREAELRAAVEQQVRLAVLAGNPFAYSLRAALVASPTPTGPEPTTRMSRDEAVRSVIPADVLRNLDNPLRKHRHCPGPATPEPTKETP